MGEIRSSWEIAQEKADKLGDLSLEERVKKREEEYWGTRDIVCNVPIGIDWEHFMDEDEEAELYKKFYIPDEMMPGQNTHDQDAMSDLLASLSQAGETQDQP